LFNRENFPRTALRSTGKGYQTRINAVLRSYVKRMRRDESPT
jgi:hypothetical protein